MLVDDFDPLKGKRLEILRKDGSVNKELEPKIDDGTLLKAYRTMVLTRVADDKAVKLQRQGRLGAYPPTKGQEASQIGPALAMGPDDWLVWAFRELGGLIYRGVPLWRLYLYWMGNEEGSSYPEGRACDAIGRPGRLAGPACGRHRLRRQDEEGGHRRGVLLRRRRHVRRGLP